MATFKCETCGAELNFDEGQKIITCEFCGTKQTLPSEYKLVDDENSEAEKLVKRGFMLLEDGKSEKADKYFDKALDADPENGRAYFGKLLVSMDETSIYGLALAMESCGGKPSKWRPKGDAGIYFRRVMELAPDEIDAVFDWQYRSGVFLMKERRYQSAIRTFEKIYHFRDTKEKIEECKRLLKQQRAKAPEREVKDYDRAVEIFNEAESKGKILFNGLHLRSCDTPEEADKLFAEISDVIKLYRESYDIFVRLQNFKDGEIYISNIFSGLVFCCRDYANLLERRFLNVDYWTKQKFLSSLYSILDETCTFLEDNDKRELPGGNFIEDLRDKLNNYKNSPKDPPPPEPEKAKKGKSGCLAIILKVIFILIVIYLVIRLLS